MLEPAIKHEEKLKELFKETYFNEKYKYFYAQGYPDNIDIKTDGWELYQFASIHKNKIIGYIEYQILRNHNNVRNLCILGFDNNPAFVKDLLQAFDDIFYKFQFHKIKFSAAVSNPATKIYDKYVPKLGGKILCTLQEEWKLWDGKYYDVREYEILASNYKSLKKNLTKV